MTLNEVRPSGPEPAYAVLSSRPQPRFYSACQKLLAAMLLNAVEDAEARQPELASEAREWLQSSSERPFSCRWTCRMLNLQPDTLQQRLQQQRWTWLQ